MSFINLMADDVWSEADIKRRLHAEIRAVVSEEMEIEISRAIMGHSLGMHALTAPEGASIQLFKDTTDRVALLGTQARDDMVLLAEVLALEGDSTALLEASEAVQALYSLRSPVPEPEVIAEPTSEVTE